MGDRWQFVHFAALFAVGKGVMEGAFRGRVYRACPGCGSVFVDPSFHPTPEAEKARYEKHSDDISDPGYRQFVSPLVEAIISRVGKGSLGLDFGSGRGAIVSAVLAEKGLRTERYDPFFWPDRSVLRERYDYIACCEVAEHFREPSKEFRLLLSLLKESGILFVMTDLLRREVDFGSWYYKDDETHLFFYSKETFEWIRSHFGYGEISIEGRVVVLSL